MSLVYFKNGGVFCNINCARSLWKLRIKLAWLEHTGNIHTSWLSAHRSHCTHVRLWTGRSQVTAMPPNCHPKGQAEAKEMTNDENKDPKHPPTSAPMSSLATKHQQSYMERISCFWNRYLKVKCAVFECRKCICLVVFTIMFLVGKKLNRIPNNVFL